MTKYYPTPEPTASVTVEPTPEPTAPMPTLQPSPTPEPTATPTLEPTPAETVVPEGPTTIGTPEFPETHTSTHVPVVDELAVTGADGLTLPLAGLGLLLVVFGVLVVNVAKRVRRGRR